jgi:hypothetical protein
LTMRAARTLSQSAVMSRRISSFQKVASRHRVPPPWGTPSSSSSSISA